MVQSYADGGVKMIDMKDMQKSFILKWIKMLFGPGNGHWRCIPQYYFSKFATGLNVFKCSAKINNFAGIPIFYQKLLETWQNVKTDNDHTMLWNNDELNISGKSVCFKNWISKGINFIYDIVNQGRVKTYDDISAVVGRNPLTFIQYIGLKSSLTNEVITLYGTKPISIRNTPTLNGKIITSFRTSEFRDIFVKKRKTCIN